MIYLKIYFIALKAEIDKLDINRLVNVPSNLNNLKIKVVDLEVDKLKIVPTKETKFTKKIEDVDKKLFDVSGLVTTTALDTKIKEIDNTIPDLSGLLKKTYYEVEILEREEKYFTAFDYNKFTSDILDAKIKQRGLVNKYDISKVVKYSDLNTKLATLAKKQN